MAVRFRTWLTIIALTQRSALQHDSFAKHPDRRPAEIVGCVIDVDAALASNAAAAAVNIDTVSRECTEKDFNDEITPNACASAVFAVSGAVVFVATFLAGLAVECGPNNSTRAAVGTAESLAIAGALSQIGRRASAMSLDCDRNKLKLAEFAVVENPGTRFTTCVVSGNFAAGSLARAALAINAGVQDCQKQRTSSSIERTVCSVNIIAVLTSLVYAGSFIAYMRDVCGFYNSESACAGDILQVTAATGVLLIESMSLSTVFPLTGNFVPIIPFFR